MLPQSARLLRFILTKALRMADASFSVICFIILNFEIEQYSFDGRGAALSLIKLGLLQIIDDGILIELPYIHIILQFVCDIGFEADLIDDEFPQL